MWRLQHYVTPRSALGTAGECGKNEEGVTVLPALPGREMSLVHSLQYNFLPRLLPDRFSYFSSCCSTHCQSSHRSASSSLPQPEIN